MFFLNSRDDMARIDSAFMKYIHRTLPSQMKDTNQILVGHAKVLKYFILRFVSLFIIFIFDQAI